jgi:hypothetical protein
MLIDAVRMTPSLRVLTVLLALASLPAGATRVEAADSPVGTWVKKTEAGKSEMTLTVEAWGPGKGKLTWRFKKMDLVITVVSALDGSDAPMLVNGKPSGGTMAIKLIDKHHSVTVVKMDGKAFGTSKGTYSEDFTTLTVDNDYAAAGGGNAAGKSTEIWIRK